MTSCQQLCSSIVQWIEPGQVERVHLVRTKTDRREAEIPEGVVLHFTWAQLVNPIHKLPSP
jgi:hypothetical protein